MFGDQLENVRLVSDHILSRAGALGLPVQGRGLLLGLTMPGAATDVQKALFSRRILTGTSTDPRVLRLMPPLSFTIAESEHLMDGIVDALA